MEGAMLKNMIEKTGKPIKGWIKIVKEKDFLKHGEIRARLLLVCYSMEIIII